MLEPAIVRRYFELFERFDPEIVMETPGVYFSDSWYCRKNCNYTAFTAETVQHGEPPVEQDVANRARDARPDPRNLFETLDSLLAKSVSHRMRQTPKHVCGTSVRLDSKAVGPLLREYVRNFIQPPCDIDIRAYARGSPDLR